MKAIKGMNNNARKKHAKKDDDFCLCFSGKTFGVF
jgi:hypothetical protein